MKSGDKLILSADVGLQVSREIFTLMLDVISPEDPTLRSRALIDIRGKRAPWSGTIDIPTGTRPFQLLADELSALLPKDDAFTEESLMDIDTGSIDSLEMPPTLN